MSKISRFAGNLLAFAINATGTNRTVFGDVTQSDTLDDNVNADYLLGWEIVIPSEVPTKEDFNGLAFTLGQLIAYLHQVGVPEWQTDQEFHINSFTNRNGVLFVSKINTNTGNDPDTDDGTNWVDANTLNADLSASALTHNMASDADYTLSEFGNRKGVLRITDTGVVLTGVVNIILNTIPRIFYAINDTAEDLVYKAAGGTGVTVPAGTSTLLRNDGTNVEPVTTEVSAASIGAAQIDTAELKPVVQTVNTQSGSVATGSTALPIDDSIPQNTEGDQYMSLSITPKDASNILEIECIVNLGHSASTARLAAALFQDTTANALIAAGVSSPQTDQDSTPIILKYRVVAGSISLTTFKVRAGSSAGTTTFNGANSVRDFGGVNLSSITITEKLP